MALSKSSLRAALNRSLLVCLRSSALSDLCSHIEQLSTVVSASGELDAGEYIVMPCTFDPSKEGEFVLKTTAGKLRRLSRSKDWKESTRDGAWTIGKSAGGCKNHKSFNSNPQFPFSLTEKTSAIVSIFQSEKEKFNPIGWYILKTEGTVLSTTFDNKC